MIRYSNTPCTTTPSSPSAMDRLNSRINSVSRRVGNAEYKVNKLDEDINDVEDALCELSGESEVDE